MRSNVLARMPAPGQWEIDQGSAPARKPSAALSMPISLPLDQDLNPAHQAWLARVVSRGRQFYQRLSQALFTFV